MTHSEFYRLSERLPVPFTIEQEVKNILVVAPMQRDRVATIL